MSLMLSDSFGFILNQAGRRFTQLLTLRYQPYDITTEQWAVLGRLSEQDGITQKELARRADKDQTNITRILDQLERKALIERRANAADRRSFLTYITEKGQELFEKLVPIEQEVIGSVLCDLTEDQVISLRAMLAQVTNRANQCMEEMGELEEHHAK